GHARRLDAGGQLDGGDGPAPPGDADGPAGPAREGGGDAADVPGADERRPARERADADRGRLLAGAGAGVRPDRRGRPPRGGGAGGPEGRRALRAIRPGFRPNKVVALRAAADPAADELIPLLKGKTAAGAVTTYVCQNYACQAPLTGAAAVEQALSQ